MSARQRRLCEVEEQVRLLQEQAKLAGPDVEGVVDPVLAAVLADAREMARLVAAEVSAERVDPASQPEPRSTPNRRERQAG